jgi:general secretion pathway protein H
MISARSRSIPPGSRSPGFTLIEMIVVLAVIALVLAIAIPNLGRSPARPALAATAHDVAASLRLARNRAITRNRPTRFLATAGSFGAGDGNALQPVPRGIALEVSGGGIDGRMDDIRFFPDGSSTGGRIDVTAGAARYAVLVDWINGNVSIEAGRMAPPR